MGGKQRHEARGCVILGQPPPPRLSKGLLHPHPHPNPLQYNSPRDAFAAQGPQRRPQEAVRQAVGGAVSKSVGGGYCRLQMPVRLARGVRETVAGHKLGALHRGGSLHP